MSLKAIMVVWANGKQEYLKEGNCTACFASMSEARKQIEFMKTGMDPDEYQSINIVSYPRRKP